MNFSPFKFLLPSEAFANTYTDPNNWGQYESFYVYKSPEYRFKITIEHQGDIAAGVLRRDIADAHRLDLSQEDANQFAKDFTRLMCGHLSMRQLEALVRELQTELDAQKKDYCRLLAGR